MLTKSIAVKQTTISSATSTTATAYYQPVKYQSICWLHLIKIQHEKMLEQSNYNNEASLNVVHDKTVLFGGLVSQRYKRYPKPAVGEENILTDK
ncbi:hypothetical protein T03_12180 [Trichinella britovi]|uniref:Uncharacterized protein n=1 Tax=Trichinella britovi TaxID=45882 RepID=A0A0V1DGE9_TRIBR|nr:hypothetical protein T03_12180 [Trichinella britovi]